MVIRASIGMLIILFHFLLNSCEKDQPLIPLERKTEHFHIISDSHKSTTGEIQHIAIKAEELFAKLENLLGDIYLPFDRITIRLEGQFTSQGPYFDTAGIHLFRYTEEEKGYLALLAHEMVHAIREDYYLKYEPYQWSDYPYYDEGFSEYMATLIDPDKTGFPLYGFSETLVVGHLLHTNKDITHDILRSQHFVLNNRCNLQTYPLRSSWFRYLHLTFGLEPLIEIIYTTVNPTPDRIAEITGVSLSIIDQDWETWAIANYDQIDQAGRVAADYVARTSWYEHCDP